jgi:hypothetical protein
MPGTPSAPATASPSRHWRPGHESAPARRAATAGFDRMWEARPYSRQRRHAPTQRWPRASWMPWCCRRRIRLQTGRLDAVTEYFELGARATAPGQGAWLSKCETATEFILRVDAEGYRPSSTRLAVLAERALRIDWRPAVPRRSGLWASSTETCFSPPPCVRTGWHQFTHQLARSCSKAVRRSEPCCPRSLVIGLPANSSPLGAADIAPIGASRESVPQPQTAGRTRVRAAATGAMESPPISAPTAQFP